LWKYILSLFIFAPYPHFSVSAPVSHVNMDLTRPESGFLVQVLVLVQVRCVQLMAEARLPAILFGMWNQTGNVKICSVPPTLDRTTPLASACNAFRLICIVLDESWCWLVSTGGLRATLNVICQMSEMDAARP